MSNYYYYPATPVDKQTYTANRYLPYISNSTFSMASIGAIIAGTSSAAKNIRYFQNDEVDITEAVTDVLKESVGSGLATAAAAAAVRVVAPSNRFFYFATMVSVAIGAKYLWDSTTNFVETKSQKK